MIFLLVRALTSAESEVDILKLPDIWEVDGAKRTLRTGNTTLKLNHTQIDLLDSGSNHSNCFHCFPIYILAAA
jgi:hypothetical protein